MTKISVIIPVYNAEKYVGRCVDSLIGQSHSDCEFIFVNDGSTDSSIKILENYKNSDSRIFIINKANEGVSIARNTGIEAAQGDFIAFADADDFLESDMLEKLLAAAYHYRAEIVVSNFFKTIDGALTTDTLPFADGAIIEGPEIGKTLMPYFLREEILNQCWNKLFKRSVLTKDVRFPAGVALGEDGLFNISAFLNSERIVFIDYAGYHYEEVSGSATRDLSKHDYFRAAMRQFEFDHASIPGIGLPSSEIAKYKSIKLVNHVISYVGIYMKGGFGSGFWKRISYVKSMVTDKIVRNSAALYYPEIAKGKTRYQIFILNCIKNKRTFLLIAAALYSNFRNTKP